MKRRRSLVHVLTVADSLVFIDMLVKTSLTRGYDVRVVTSPDERLRAFGKRLGVEVTPLEMPRRVTPLGDWRALEQLHRLLSRWRPDVVHAHTPKGGLLGCLAAHAAGVPVRLYHMRGLPFVTMHGAMRTLMQTTERVSCSAATHVICQSESLKHTALASRLVAPDKCEVVLQGSNGVDCDQRFVLERYAKQAAELRTTWGIGSNATVIGFVGRLVRDKGVPELVEAFTRLAKRHADTWLVLAGGEEPRDPIDERTRITLRTHPRIRTLGFTPDPAPIYAAVDFVALPSHREGFPNVPLEAAAMKRAVVSTRVDGCTDAVQDGVTGILVQCGDVEALERALDQYVGDRSLCERHGLAGRLRIEQNFRRDTIANAMMSLYEREIARG